MEGRRGGGKGEGSEELRGSRHETSCPRDVSMARSTHVLIEAKFVLRSGRQLRGSFPAPQFMSGQPEASFLCKQYFRACPSQGIHVLLPGACPRVVWHGKG